VLFQDLLDHPDQYEEGVDELLQLLLSGRRNLSELDRHEQDLLNRATVVFAQSSHQVPKALQPSVATPSEEDYEGLEDIVEPEPVGYNIPQDVPEGWWRGR